MMPGDGSLRRKLLWLLALRAAAVTVVLGSGILVEISSPGALPVDPFFFLIGVTYGLTALYGLLLRHVERHRWLIDLQLGLDALIASAIVLFTGGVTSYFTSLFALPIIAASILQFRRGGLMVGILSVITYTGVVLLQYLQPFGPIGWLPGSFRVLPPVHVALYTVTLNGIGFLGVAWLTGYLAEGLRRADQRLERASSQIADLQAFNQHVIDSMTSGLVTTDPQGRILTFNRAAQVITGHEAAGVTDRPLAEVLRLPQDFVRLLGQGLEHGRSLRVEFGYTPPDGADIEIGLAAAPLLTSGGRAGFLFSFQDVTHAKKLEREARVQQRLAAVGEMAAGIAHEIRNPLASMSGSIQILRQELPLTDEQAQLMDIVLRESERLNETIGSFLAYARPQRLSTVRLDLRRVISDTAVLLRNSTDMGDRHELAVDLPEAEVWFDADEGQIRQVIWNLATNGLRAMPAGGRLRLAASVEPEPGGGTWAVLEVEDQGVGIPPEELDLIFQPFRGAFDRGTGLGLAIVHRIVGEYGGGIQVSSRPGSGTTMRVKLAVAPVGGGQWAVDRPRAAANGSPSNAQRKGA